MLKYATGMLFTPVATFHHLRSPGGIKKKMQQNFSLSWSADFVMINSRYRMQQTADDGKGFGEEEFICRIQR